MSQEVGGCGQCLRRRVGVVSVSQEMDGYGQMSTEWVGVVRVSVGVSGCGQSFCGSFSFCI